MEIKNPFSLYDFLGYFVPGALCLYILLFLLDMSDVKSFDEIANFHFGRVDLSIAFVIFAYITGHAINYISSITIEKYSNWMFGYPSAFLLKNERKGYYKKAKKEELEEWLKGNIEHCKIHLYIKKKMYKCKYKWMQKLSLFRLRSLLWRFLLLLFIFPVSFVDWVLGKRFGLRLYYTNPLDNVLILSVQKNLKSLLHNLNIQGDDNFDFNRILNHYYYEKFDKHILKFDNYVALYGFCRCLSLIFCLTTSSLILLLWFSYSVQLTGRFVVLCSLSSFLSFVFFMAFMKFYRRYTLECFMCLVIDKTLEK